MKRIDISGVIGFDVLPVNIKNELRSASGGDVDIHIASPGGLISDGLEIDNAIKDYKRDYPNSQMMVTGKGVVASMASYVMMNPAFDIVAAEENAVFMIHNALGIAVGDYRDMNKMSSILEGFTDLLCDAYVAKCKKKKKKVREMMDAESWFFGAEIKDAGFVDEILPSPEKHEKDSMMNVAKSSFYMMTEKLGSQKTDYDKIAAMIKPTAQNPASAGNNNLEVITMTLDELMAQNPAAKIEFEKKLEEKRIAGYEEGKSSVLKNVQAATKYVDPTGTYPSQIKALALDVMAGKKSLESLETTVTAFDAYVESAKSQTASTEQPPATPGQQQKKISDDGVINTVEDFTASINAMRTKLGIGGTK